MSDFTEPVEFISTNDFHEGRRLYKLTRQLVWEVGHLGSANYVVVEKGFLTDFVSIPAFFHGFLNSSGRYAAAGVMHDKLYTVLKSNRYFADAQLYDAMIALGSPKYLAWVVWAAVRLFGKKIFEEKKPYVN